MDNVPVTKDTYTEIDGIQINISKLATQGMHIEIGHDGLGIRYIFLVHQQAKIRTRLIGTVTPAMWQAAFAILTWNARIALLTILIERKQEAINQIYWATPEKPLKEFAEDDLLLDSRTGCVHRVLSVDTTTTFSKTGKRHVKPRTIHLENTMYTRDNITKIKGPIDLNRGYHPVSAVHDREFQRLNRWRNVLGRLQFFVWAVSLDRPWLHSSNYELQFVPELWTWKR